MKMRRVFITIVAILLVMTLLFTACTKTEETTETKTEDTKSTEKKEDTKKEETSNFNKTGLPIVNETVTIEVVVRRGTKNVPLKEMGMFANLEEATNIHIEWQELDSGYKEKTALMLASGDLPDLFYGNGLADSDILGNIEVFVPLTALIEEYAPNYTKMMDRSAEFAKIAIAPDGEMYSLASRLPHRPIAYAPLVMNKTWLDNLGLDIPVTTDDFYDVLLAFKDGDPNGNGDTTDEIPWSSSSWNRFDWLYGSFGLMGNREKTTKLLQVNDGKVKFLAITDEYKAFVQYLNKINSAGLLDKETFTQDETQWRAKLRNEGGDGYIVGSALVFTIESMFGPDSADHYVALPPLVGPFGDQLFRDNSLNPINRNRGSITTSNENPEITMRWLDEMYTDDMSVQLQYGTIGEQLEITADGMYDFLPLDDPNMSYDVSKWMFAPANWAPMGVYKELEARIIPNPSTKAKVAMDNELSKYTDSQYSYPKVFMDKETTDELSIIQADIQNMVDQKLAKWVVEGGVEEEWDQYIADIEAMGLERFVEIYQNELDKYNAS